MQLINNDGPPEQSQLQLAHLLKLAYLALSQHAKTHYFFCGARLLVLPVPFFLSSSSSFCPLDYLKEEHPQQWGRCDVQWMGGEWWVSSQ